MCGCLPDAGDVRGADAVAVRDRSEPLHRRTQQPAERLGFGLAQLRELGRHVRDRAVMLAELLAGFGDLDPAVKDLSRVMNNHRSGDTVKLTIYRGKKKMDVNVTLGEAREQV